MSEASSSTFERAALAVVDGDMTVLGKLLGQDDGLVRAQGPAPFRATLLHYLAANGVEDELQRTPENAVEVCERLLAAGAAPDALAASYCGGNNQTPLCLLVSSWHPFERGVQADLVSAMVRGGARVNGIDDDAMPLWTALVFGYTGAAEMLVACGSRVDNIFCAAGLGDASQVAWRLTRDEIGPFVSPIGAAGPSDRAQVLQQALHFAVTHGRREIVDLLVDRGADPNGRVSGHHCELPLLQAMFVAENEMVRLLVERGADLDQMDGKHGISARQYRNR